MVRDIKTDKDYYISQGMDGSSVWYEVTDKAFKPAMVSNTLPGKKEKILLSTKATVNPKDAGPSGNEPFRKLTKDESYIISIMEKGIKEQRQGITGKKEYVPGEGWVQPGKWVDANDPDYRMGLENIRLWDEVQPGFYDDIITKGVDEPSEGLKGFIIDKKPSDSFLPPARYMSMSVVFTVAKALSILASLEPIVEPDSSTAFSSGVSFFNIPLKGRTSFPSTILTLSSSKNIRFSLIASFSLLIIVD